MNVEIITKVMGMGERDANTDVVYTTTAIALGFNASYTFVRLIFICASSQGQLKSSSPLDFCMTIHKSFISDRKRDVFKNILLMYGPSDHVLVRKDVEFNRSHGGGS
nr:hypothetical protein [Tanacetum cinerariifolium]